jgi:hypothetical protein
VADLRPLDQEVRRRFCPVTEQRCPLLFAEVELRGSNAAVADDFQQLR